LETTHSLNDEMRSPIQGKNLCLSAQDVDTYRTLGLVEDRFPFLDSIEHEWDELGPLQLSSTRINPDHGFRLLSTQQNQVMVRGDDDLIRLPGVSKNDVVTGTPARSLVTGMSHVAGLYAELP